MSRFVQRGFTLIELLVAISVLAILAGMAMPMVGLAKRTAARKNTESLLAKVETGLRLFKVDMSIYPFQDHPTTAAAFPAADNRLGWALAHDLTVAERADLDDDLAKARKAYGPGGAHALAMSDIDPVVGTYTPDLRTHAGAVNRLATERATLAILSGNTSVKGLRNKPTTSVITGAKSSGYASDYIGSDLAREQLQGERVVDLFRQPLVYICPVIPPMRRIIPADTDRPIDIDYYGLTASGRKATTSLASDMRDTAPQRLRFRYELLSAGPDRAIQPQRDEAANRDNLVLGEIRGELQ